jgi:hypothetical protein
MDFFIYVYVQLTFGSCNGAATVKKAHCVDRTAHPPIRSLASSFTLHAAADEFH